MTDKQGESLLEKVRSVFAGREVDDCRTVPATEFLIKYVFQGEEDDYNEDRLLVRHVSGDQWRSVGTYVVPDGTLEEIRNSWYAHITGGLLVHVKRMQALLSATVQELAFTTAPKKGALVFVRDNEGWVVGDKEVYVYPVLTRHVWRAGSRDMSMHVGNTAQDAVDKLFEAMPAQLDTLNLEADEYTRAAVRVTELLARAGITYVPADPITE